MSIEYLIGQPHLLQNFGEKPFNSNVINFLDDLSNDLKSLKATKDYPDIVTLSFFLRKNNLINMKNKFYNEKENRVGSGLLFHITPSNIPTNFAYSLFFGLITGNANIVKVPSKNHPQVSIICNSITKVLKKNKKIKNRVCILRYNKNNDMTSKLSSICDLRLIWGGNKTINEIRKFQIKERSQDILFADRYSFCIIDNNKFNKLTAKQIKDFVKKFYIDTFLVDQNGCSSPHLIIWHGTKKNKNKEIFWEALYKEAKNKYSLNNKASYEKFAMSCNYVLNEKKFLNFKNYQNYLYRFEIKKLDKDVQRLKGKWGVFFEYNCKNLNQINKIVNKNFQTLTYFGFEKENLVNHIINNKLKGIDRIVPVGQSLNINLLWDGYDLSKSLTRIIGLQ